MTISVKEGLCSVFGACQDVCHGSSGCTLITACRFFSLRNDRGLSESFLGFWTRGDFTRGVFRARCQHSSEPLTRLKGQSGRRPAIAPTIGSFPSRGLTRFAGQTGKGFGTDHGRRPVPLMAGGRREMSHAKHFPVSPRPEVLVHTPGQARFLLAEQAASPSQELEAV